jgi:GT2 family glycosyltransferase
MQIEEQSRIWVVIVNYRTADLVIDCLHSLAQQSRELHGGRVLIIDNASGDGSAERIRHAISVTGWFNWAEVVPLDRNGGFAFGNNAGIRLAMAVPEAVDYLLLLNPDTIVRPGAIRALVELMARYPKAGIAGSLLETPGGGVDRSAHRIHSPLSELLGGARLGLLSRLLHAHVVSPPVRQESHTCDWVSGACMLLRRRVVEEIGLMDEAYFLYFEEVDYCWRTKQAGWDVWYVPTSRVLHIEGASTGIRRAASRRASYWYDSRRRFFIKHYGLIGLVWADVLWGIGRLSLLLRNSLGHGGTGLEADPKRFMADLIGGDLKALANGQATAIRRGEAGG